LIFLIKRGSWNGRGIAGRLLILLWCLPSLSMLYAQTLFEVRKRNVLQTDVVRVRTLGQHFVVGYSSLDEVVPLARKGPDRRRLLLPATISQGGRRRR
jgi:beta-N-acetylhexosaminidase